MAAETSMVSTVNRGGNWLHNTFRLIVPSVLSKGQTSPLEFQAGQNAANAAVVFLQMTLHPEAAIAMVLISHITPIAFGNKQAVDSV